MARGATVKSLVCKALFESDDFNIEEASDAINKDLDREMGDSDTMHAAEFMNSLFETVSVPTSTSNELYGWWAGAAGGGAPSRDETIHRDVARSIIGGRLDDDM